MIIKSRYCCLINKSIVSIYVHCQEMRGTRANYGTPRRAAACSLSLAVDGSFDRTSFSHSSVIPFTERPKKTLWWCSVGWPLYACSSLGSSHNNTSYRYMPRAREHKHDARKVGRMSHPPLTPNKVSLQASFRYNICIRYFMQYH